MNTLKIVGISALLVGAIEQTVVGLQRDDWVFIISVLIAVLGMIQEYLKMRQTATLIDQTKEEIHHATPTP